MTLKKLFMFWLVAAWHLPAGAHTEEIVFASPKDYSPKIIHSDGEFKGVHVDVIREICRRMNVKPVFEVYPWARAISLAQSGKVDAIFPLLKTTDRAEFLYFPTESISITRNVVFGLKKRHLHMKSLEDLKGLIVGINNQFAYGTKFDTYKKHLTLDLSITDEMLANKLVRGNHISRIDVAVAAEENFIFVNRELGFEKLIEVVYVISEDPAYIAFSKAKGKKAKAWSENFSKILAQLKKEGFVKKTHDKYLN